MRFNPRAIVGIFGILLLIEAVALGAVCLYAALVGEITSIAFGLAASTTGIVGLLFLLLRGGRAEIQKRDIYLVVTLGWVLVSVFGMLPYIFSGVIPEITNAFFETVSGFTTTGATIITNFDVPSSILLWRSITQWIGGMGIVVLMLAILPILGIGGMQLYNAEGHGVGGEKLRPRIKETAIIMWIVYITFTGAAIVLLALGDMSLFQAVNHGFTTMAIGGFSTEAGSLAAFGAYSQYVVILFMFLAGTNFALLYMGLRGRLREFLKNEEFKYYVSIVLLAILLVTWYRFLHAIPLEEALRGGAFQVVSIITTTGFTTEDYSLWPGVISYFIFILMFVGAMTGSTTGGVKIMRHVILIKDSIIEFKKQLHPHAIVPLRFNGVLVRQSVLYRVLAFVMLYVIFAVLSAGIMMLLGVDGTTSVGSVVASIGNIGPGFGEVGPSGSYAGLPDAGKWFLTFLMIVGRLEIFTVLMLFTPYFWRKY